LKYNSHVFYSKATGSLCQPLHKIDVSIRANSVFSQCMYLN